MLLLNATTFNIKSVQNIIDLTVEQNCEILISFLNTKKVTNKLLPFLYSIHNCYMHDKKTSDSCIKNNYYNRVDVFSTALTSSN